MRDSQNPRMRWPVNDEPLNTFGTLELLFPLFKKEFVLVLFKFPKMIVLNLLRFKNHHSCFLLICKMYCCFIPKWIVCSWHCRVIVLCLHTTYPVWIFLFMINHTSLTYLHGERLISPGMEIWNQDHPERYSNFCGLYIKFQWCGLYRTIEIFTLLEFCLACFGILFCCVVFGCRYTP